MAEYIEREMSLKTIDEYFHITNPDGEEQIGVLKSRKIIRTLPAADVAPVRRGKWLEWFPGDCSLIMTGEEMLYRCSSCDAKYADAEEYKYCPNCGARMDGDYNGA